MTTTVNYTPEMTSELVDTYVSNPTDATVSDLAVKFTKSTRSIVAKLTREGVYQKKVYTSKTGEAVVTKAALVAKLAELAGVEATELQSLEKATKGALQSLVDSF